MNIKIRRVSPVVESEVVAGEAQVTHVRDTLRCKRDVSTEGREVAIARQEGQ
jgi:hypothetical protein